MDNVEKELFSQGYEKIVGIDEAGRGPLAGPLVIASVIFPKHQKPFIHKDSKGLSEKEREYLFEKNHDYAEEINITIVENTEIDKLGISNAVKIYMENNLKSLKSKWDIALIDFVKLDKSINHLPLIKGDEISHTIAAASIIAKVVRDRIMIEYKEKYPNFSFDKHKGYATKQHYQEIKKFGITPIHRRSFNLGVSDD
jgi:ribonuclease HII